MTEKKVVKIDQKKVELSNLDKTFYPDKYKTPLAESVPKIPKVEIVSWP